MLILERIVRVVKLGGFVASDPAFHRPRHLVINGCIQPDCRNPWAMPESTPAPPSGVASLPLTPS